MRGLPMRACHRLTRFKSSSDKGPRPLSRPTNARRHSEVLRYIPCYCGCVDVGHISNEDCFIDRRPADGRTVYDPMGKT
jgi:hypothetical protein